MNQSLVSLLATAVRLQGPLAEKARAVALNAAEHGRITGDEAATRARLTAWLEEPEGGMGVLWGAPGSGKTTFLARWLPDVAARGYEIVWVPLHRVAGLGTERAALAMLRAALGEMEARVHLAHFPDEMWRWCVHALYYERDPSDGDAPLLVVVDGMHEAVGWRVARRFEAVDAGAHVKLLLTDHGPALEGRARNIPFEGPTPEVMRQTLERVIGQSAQSSALVSEVHMLRALATAPRPLPPRLLRRLEPGDAATWLAAAAPVCSSDDRGHVHLEHGAYRALLADIAGPFDEARERAELGEACLADIAAADDSDTRSLLADLVGEEWPSIEGAALLLEPAWLDARWTARSQVFDALMDVRRARAAAVGSLANEVQGSASPRVVDALRIVAESAVLEAVIATLARSDDRGRKWTEGLESATVARTLTTVHARGATACMEVSRKARAKRRAPPWKRPWSSLGEIRDQLDRDAAEDAWGRYVVELVRAGRAGEALDALADLPNSPFYRACTALGAAAALPGHMEMEQAARAAVDTVLYVSAVVGEVPGAVCTVLGTEAALSMAADGPEYQRVQSFVTLLPYLPTDADRRRAADAAFAAWTTLPPHDDAEGAILPAIEWLSNAQALSVLDRLLASFRNFNVRLLVSPRDPSSLIANLSVFHKLGGEPAVTAAWNSLAKVAAALSPQRRKRR